MMHPLSSSVTPPSCTACGSALPVDGPCPRCLMAELVQPTQMDEGTGHMVQPPFSAEELAPHFPQLEILHCLGRGGMGIVYKARQKSLNRLVALKLLAPERSGDRDFALRFASEAQSLAALSHPNIVAVYDFGEAGGFFFLLMEYVDGVNLRQLLRSKRLTPEEALSIVPPVCDALQCAHEKGIVHRDIKPENLLLDRQGVVKIADFGIAKMIGSPANGVGGHSSGETFGHGTPAYAAPEQLSRANTDHRADIFSLGVVLYEMLTGSRPTAALQPPSRKVQMDVRIDEIVLRALETTPEKRYATAIEFRTQVDAVIASPHAKLINHWPKRIALAITGAAAIALTVLALRKPETQTLPQAITDLEAAYTQLLQAKRQAAYDRTDADSPELRQLSQRVQVIEQTIHQLSAKSPPSP